MAAGASAGAEAANGVEVFSDEEAWDVLEEIPSNSTAALLLIEHHWRPCRRATWSFAWAGSGSATASISPLDLVEIGLVSREEADRLHAMGTCPVQSA